MRWTLLVAMLGLLASAVFAAEESPAGDAPKGENPATAKKPAPVEDTPKKTEYDKLPLPQLIVKANGNDLTAQFELASRFNYGRGIPRNTGEALRWLRKAAWNGQEDAARLLAVKFYDGHDVVPDYAEAMRWATVLAEKGDIPAQLMLASMYANGEGALRDLVQAYKWYAIAAVGAKREGSKEEPKQEQVQSAIEARDKLASLLTDDQETLGQQLASDWWLKKHATLGKAVKTKKPTSK
jgi:hypothetical protein